MRISGQGRMPGVRAQLQTRRFHPGHVEMGGHPRLSHTGEAPEGTPHPISEHVQENKLMLV